ncbi:MAG: HTH domain-containing protein [Nitrososphaerales archaeon]
MHNLGSSIHKYKIEDRRRRVATMLAQSMNESEIAKELSVNQSTVSRDISFLKKLSQQFVKIESRILLRAMFGRDRSGEEKNLGNN